MAAEQLSGAPRRETLDRTGAYAFAELGGTELGLVRLGGAGLGNLLFPWARSLVAAKTHGLTVISPTWPQLVPSALLRGGGDRRIYAGLFGKSPGAIGGPAKVWLLATRPRVPEIVLQGAGPVPRDSIITFRGMSARGLREHHALVADALWSMSLPAHRDRVARVRRRSVAVHVRLGDFVPAIEGAAPEPNTRLGLAWYVEKVTQLRAALGDDVPVDVFSDGRDDELAPLLALAATRRASYRTPLADLLAMSTYSALVASRSTFSMWSSYIGQVPTLWPPMHLTPDLLVDRAAQVEVGAGSSVPAAFCDAVRAAMTGARAREP